MGVVPVLLQGFTLDREHRDVLCRDGGSRMVLGGEDVAGGPAHLGTQFDEGFDQTGGLDRHVQRTGDARPLQGLLSAVFLTQRHQTGHLGLGDVQLFAAERGLGDICNNAVGA